jgi:hypothetical protein
VPATTCQPISVSGASHSTARITALVAAVALVAVQLSACTNQPRTAPPDDLSFRQPHAPHLRDHGTVRPEDFGAVGDGVTDDSAAIDATLRAAADRGATVVLAARTYRCGSSVEVPSGSHLVGEGPRSRLAFTWTENTSTTDGYLLGNADQRHGNHDIALEDFAIVGAGTGLPSGPAEIREAPRVPGIRLRLVDRFVISGLTVTKVAGISVLYQGSSEGVIADNHIHDVGRDGITGTWHDRNLTNVVVRDNLIERIGDDGIALVGAPGEMANRDQLPTDLLVEDNVIRGWRRNPNGLLIGRGIALLAVRRVKVVGNVVDRTQSNGILVAGSTRDFSTDPATGQPWRSDEIRIEGNAVLSAGQNQAGSQPVTAESGGTGIIVKQSHHVALIDNDVRDSRESDVALFGCGECYAPDLS